MGSGADRLAGLHRQRRGRGREPGPAGHQPRTEGRSGARRGRAGVPRAGQRRRPVLGGRARLPRPDQVHRSGEHPAAPGWRADGSAAGRGSAAAGPAWRAGRQRCGDAVSGGLGGTGGAGALLAELMLGGQVVTGSDSTVAAGPILPGDALARQVRNQIAGEPEQHVLLEWLLFLGQSVTEGVGHRLERAGYLIPAARRVPWRSPRWVPSDPDWAFAPLLRARPATDPARPLTAHAVILAGLAAGCGLQFRLDQYFPAAGRSIEQAVSLLTPDLRQLDGAVQAAVAGAVLAHRT